MEKGRTLEEYAAGAADVEARVRELLENAYRRAGEYGVLVGRVSRYSEVKVEEGARIEFELDPEVYYASLDAPYQRIGDYLVVLDPKTGRLVLVRVTSIVRRDELAWLKVEPPMSGYVTTPDPRGLLTRTTVYGELVVEAEPGSWKVRPAVTSVEPQSPVIDPRPDVLERLMDLPAEGVPLGALATPGGLVKGGSIPVKLPVHAFFQHVLIVGTTGSGKTTLLKNLIASIYSMGEQEPVVIVVDMNQDFIQLPIRRTSPPKGSDEEAVARRVYSRVREPRGLTVVFPLTDADLRLALEDSGGAAEPKALVTRVVEDYVGEVVLPLLGGEAPDRVGVTVAALRDGGGPAAYRASVSGLPFSLTLFAYTIATPHLSTDELLGLMPGLTPHARDLMRRLRKWVERSVGGAGPLQAVYAASGIFLETVLKRRERGGGQGDDEAGLAADLIEPYIVHDQASDSDLELLYSNVKIEGLGGVTLSEYVEAYMEAMFRVRPHRGTLEALYRRLASLLDSGIVDLIVYRSAAPSAWLLGEPSWDRIVSEARASGTPVVMDLKWAGDRGASSVEGPRLAAYRMLRSLIAWKHRAWASRGRVEAPNVIVVIDEAHQFFPQEKGDPDEREANRQVAAMISAIARLGRARGVGLVFSTHSPKDLHEIIVQLANTKILLRAERSVAEQLEVPPELRPYVPRLPDRRMIVMSHVYKEGYILAHTSTPLTGHYDIPSRLRPSQGV